MGYKSAIVSKYVSTEKLDIGGDELQGEFVLPEGVPISEWKEKLGHTLVMYFLCYKHFQTAC